MDRRRFLLTLVAGALAVPLDGKAQQGGRVYRIGYLGAGSPSAQANRVEALRAGLGDLGYVEGKNIVIEFRWAEGRSDRLSDLAAELVRLNVDVLVTGGTPAILAAKQATTTTPIVMAGSGDAVASGLVASLARPGGNVTDRPTRSRNSWRKCSSCSRRSCRVPGGWPSSSSRVISPIGQCCRPSRPRPVR